MSGRYERQAHIDKVVRDNLEDCPKILFEYFKRSSGLQASSRHVIINNIKRFFFFYEEKGIDINGTDWLKNITADDITDYLYTIKIKKLKNGKQKVLSDSTIATMLNYLKNFFEFLVKQKYISENPVEEAKDYFPKFKIQKKVVYMTPEEVNHIKNKIIAESMYPKRDLCIFMLGCRTGLRESAIIDMDISDIDFKEMKIQVVEKGNVYRDVVIDPDTIRLINECIEERGEIFDKDALFIRHEHGKKIRITSWDMSQLLEKYSIDLDKRVTPHKMRATCATNLYIATGDIYAVGDRLGHSNLENTKRYIDTVDKGRESANILAAMF